jgi:hypothetical protein
MALQVNNLIGFMVRSGSRFPIIVDSYTGNEIGVNVTTNVTMPAAVEAGDLLLVMLQSWNATSTANWFTPAGGWNLTISSLGSGQQRRLGVFYKVADGTEDGATVNFVTNNNAFNAWSVYQIRNYTGTPESSTVVTSTASAPDSGSLSPSWGTKDTLWITQAGMFNATQVPQGAAPSLYEGLLEDFGNSASADRPRHATAHRFLRAASEDPGAWPNSAANWSAHTIGIQGLA